MSVYVGLCVCVCMCVCSSRKEAGVCAEWEVCAEFRAVHSKLQLGARQGKATNNQTAGRSTDLQPRSFHALIASYVVVVGPPLISSRGGEEYIFRREVITAVLALAST